MREPACHDECEQQKDETEPDFDLRESRIVCLELYVSEKIDRNSVAIFRCANNVLEKTYEKYQFLDVVALMESLQIVKTHGYDVVGVVQETQMQHRKFFAGIPFAQQMSRPFR